MDKERFMEIIDDLAEGNMHCIKVEDVEPFNIEVDKTKKKLNTSKRFLIMELVILLLLIPTSIFISFHLLAIVLIIDYLILVYKLSKTNKKINFYELIRIKE